jgi:probable F420-dependent oxidoreductase
MSLTYCLQLPVQTQTSLIAEPWELDAGPDAIAAVAKMADARGFYAVGVCDHVAIPRESAGRMRTTWYDTIATLSWLAGQTSRVRLLSHVLVAPYRHPLVVAKAFMTIDALSDGRAILGLGAGHLETEFAALGANYARRGELTDAAIDAIRAAFTDEFVGDLGLAPRPVQSPVPIWIGGSSNAALRRAAARGDGWLPQGTPRRDMPSKIAYLRAHLEDPDKPFVITGGQFVYVGEPSWELGPGHATGTPERIAERLRSYEEMGVNNLMLHFRSRSLDELVDQVDAFGADVATLLT